MSLFAAPARRARFPGAERSSAQRDHDSNGQDVKILGFAGHSGAGKTTLIEQLIPRLRRKGLRVSVVKHAHHAFDLDKPSKDSFRHRAAGASEVMLVSSIRWALVHELHDEEEPSLEDQIARMSPCDLLLVEGFKSPSIPKIEIHRSAVGRPSFPAKAMNIVAIASNTRQESEHAGVPPQLDLNDPDAIVTFILDYLRMQQRESVERPPDMVRNSLTLADAPESASCTGAAPFDGWR